MTSAILSPDNEAFERLLDNLSEHLNAATSTPPQALFHQLILSKPGRQQVTRYLDTLSRLAHAEQNPIESQLLVQWMLPALNALVTCDTDCFPAVYRCLAAVTVSDALLLTVQKSMLYWAGDPDCWNHLLVLLSSTPAGVNQRVYSFLAEQLAVGDGSTYYHSTRDKYVQGVQIPRLIRAGVIKQLLGQGAAYINTSHDYAAEPTRKARVQRMQEQAAQLAAELETLRQPLQQLAGQEMTEEVDIPEHQLLTDMAPVMIALYLKKATPSEAQLITWVNKRSKFRLGCINTAIGLLQSDDFASTLLKSDLLLSWPKESTKEKVDSASLQSCEPVGGKDGQTEQEWITLQSQQLFEQDDSYIANGSAWLSHTIRFFDNCRHDFTTLNFEQVTALVLKQAQAYFNDCHPLADSDNPEWQQALAQSDWQERAGEVLSYGCFGQDVGDVIQNPTRQEKRVTVQTNDFIGITYKLRDPEPFPQGRVAVNNRVEVFSPAGELLRTDQWADQMIAKTTNFVLYRMELADSYAGYWRFTSWYGDQCLLQQSFHVTPAVPVTN